MFDAIYEVYESDADMSMEADKVRFQSFDRDIAETKLLKLFRQSYGLEKDFLLYNRKTQEVLCCAFCDSTIAKRGECQS